MDAVTILRELYRLRGAAGLVGVVAIAVGVGVLFKVSYPLKVESRRHEVGVATARILVDTPHSQVVEISPKGSDSLGTRANLLSTLMVDGVVKTAIARRAGLQADKLIGRTDAAAEPVEA